MWLASPFLKRPQASAVLDFSLSQRPGRQNPRIQNSTPSPNHRKLSYNRGCVELPNVRSETPSTRTLLCKPLHPIPQADARCNVHHRRPFMHRGTSLIRSSTPLGTQRWNILRALWWSYGGGQFVMSEVPLYTLYFARRREP